VARWFARRGRRISFADKTVVITGGSRGLGLLIARELAPEHCRLVLIARDPDELSRAALDVSQRGAEVLPITCDIRNAQEVRHAVERALEEFRQIDVLINDAGVIQVGPIEHMSLADFQEAMAVHLWGPLYAMSAVVPHMKERRFGRIVNVSSVGGKVAMPHLSPYTASKFALVGLSRALRPELARHGVLVTTACPSLVRTGSTTNAVFKGSYEREHAWFALAAGLPVVSMSGRRVASRIIRACRYGVAEPLISVQGRAAEIFANAFPNLAASVSELANRLLPGAVAEHGTEAHLGFEIKSRLGPPFLTWLADRAAEENNEISPFLSEVPGT
jgi:NAD(P)-dependent dehydrogenase (short-subunit alcohol dehydrogenase family)